MGQPIVWAARMETVAKSGEVIVNNLLYSALSDLSGLHFESRLGSTKTGEAFLGRSLVLTEVAEFIPPIAADRPARPHSV